MTFCERPFFSRSISANNLLLETNAISMPEKNAEKSIETRSHIIKSYFIVLSLDVRTVEQSDALFLPLDEGWALAVERYQQDSSALLP